MELIKSNIGNNTIINNKKIEEIDLFNLLKENLEIFIKTNFGKDFVFRNGQKEVILDILDFYSKNPYGLYLLDAPTGSGKSIIAIVVSGTLALTEKTGYILTSDISLQNQYETDFTNFNLNWGSIKGMVNYTCTINNENIKNGDCKSRNLNSNEIKTLPCFNTCPYYSNRLNAILSPVSLLNYSYWLIQRNYVAPKTKAAAFNKRDFIICDEAHKITEIVQNHFSPNLNNNTFEKLSELIIFLQNITKSEININKIELEKTIDTIFNETNKNVLIIELKKLLQYFSIFENNIEEMLKIISVEYNEKTIPKEITKGIGLSNWLKDLNCKFVDYVKIIDNVSVESMIKNSNLNSVLFNCIDEGYMMQKYFHQQSKFKLLMTATMGNYNNFLYNIRATGTVKYTKLKSDFNFDKSPIYLWTKRKMNWKEKENTLPWIYQKIDFLLKKHENDSGIIHTGSYTNMNKIYENISIKNKHRVLIYQNSFEKKIALEEFENPNNQDKKLIIMGPSLLEGIDLKDEKSRFQIFVKVPYPNLMDSFVQAKIKMVYGWYTWKTVIGILQGVGRSVRSKDDWAITYFLDGCLFDLINKNKFVLPVEFTNRLKLVTT